MSNSPGEDAENQRVEAYLNTVCAILCFVPSSRRDALRREVKTHVEALTEDYRARGMTASESVAAEIESMGDPRAFGLAYLVTGIKAYWKSLVSPPVIGEHEGEDLAGTTGIVVRMVPLLLGIILAVGAGQSVMRVAQVGRPITVPGQLAMTIVHIHLAIALVGTACALLSWQLIRLSIRVIRH